MEKRGRGAAGKTAVFGILKRGGKGIVRIVLDCSKENLIPIIQGLALEDLRRLDSQRLRPLPSFSQRERICPRKMSCKRNRELLEFRQALIRQVQRLRFGQVRSTLDGVPEALQSPQRRFIQGDD